jgi:hypothetical protein
MDGSALEPLPPISMRDLCALRVSLPGTRAHALLHRSLRAFRERDRAPRSLYVLDELKSTLRSQRRSAMPGKRVAIRLRGRGNAPLSLRMESRRFGMQRRPKHRRRSPWPPCRPSIGRRHPGELLKPIWRRRHGRKRRRMGPSRRPRNREQNGLERGAQRLVVDPKPARLPPISNRTRRCLPGRRDRNALLQRRSPTLRSPEQTLQSQRFFLK